MNRAKIKENIVFFLSVLLASFLVWFGFRFLFLSSSSISPSQHFIVGAIFVLSGIFLLINENISKRYFYGAILLAVGFFDLARAADIIDYPWLARTIGLSSWIAATLIVYAAYPKSNKKSSQ